MADKHINNSFKQEDTINWIEILQRIWQGRKTLFLSILIFLVLGVLYVILSPKTYKSEITLVVETNNSGSALSGLLSQFGGLSGISLDKKEKEALSPELYPDVVKSSPFLLEIMNKKVVESKYDSTITVAEYIERHTHSSPGGILFSYTIGLPGKIKKWMSRNEKGSSFEINYPLSNNDSTADTSFYPIKLTQKQSEIADALSGCINTENDFKKTNKFIISVEMQDPFVVAQVTSYVVKNLTKTIIEYRTKKAKKDFEFINARTIEAEANYQEKQQALANFKDKNKNVILLSVHSQEERLQAEYDLSYNLYNILSEQLEQAKIKVEEETPVFNVVNPAQVPLEKNSPKTTLILFVMIFLGVFTGIGIIFGKSYYVKIKSLLS